MKKRKLFIILLLLDIIAITLIVCNAKFDIFHKAIAKINAMIHPAQEYNITPHDKQKPSPIDPDEPVDPGEPDEPVIIINYPLEVTFDTMGGTTTDETSFFLDGVEKTIDDLVYPNCDYLEYEFIEWEKNEYVKMEGDDVIFVWEFVASWEYSPLTYYTKLLSVSNFNLQGSKYCREIGKDTTSCEILSNFKYRNNVAIAKLYSNSACTDEVTESEVAINPGENSFWVKIDAGVHGSEVWEVEVYRVIEYSVSFTVSGVMDEIPGLEGFVVKQRDRATLSRISSLLRKPGYTFTPSVSLNTVIDRDMEVDINVSYTTFHVNYLDTKGVAHTNTTSFTMNDEFELTPIEKEGYIFNGWYLGDEEITKVDVGTTSNLDITANWTIIVYTITYDLSGGEAENVESYTVEDSVTLNKPTRKGFVFNSWNVFDKDDNPLAYDPSFGYKQDIKVVATYNEALTSAFFGKYPQEVVADAELIARLDAVTPVDGIYKLDGNEYILEMANGFIDGIKFRDGTSVVNGQNYYFKLAPVEWVELYSNDNEYTLMSKYVLDANRFDEFTNIYYFAEISTYVENMKDKMFGEEELFNLVQSNISNAYETVNQNPDSFTNVEEWDYLDLEGYVYIPSYQEILTYMAEADTLVTDYAIAKGCLFNPINYKAFYFYRSPYAESRQHYVAGYNASGEGTSDGCLDINTAYGLRVMVCVESGEKTE